MGGVKRSGPARMARPLGARASRYGERWGDPGRRANSGPATVGFDLPELRGETPAERLEEFRAIRRAQGLAMSRRDD